MSIHQRIHIALDQCEGHGQCAAVAPRLYELDNDGFALRADFEVASELVDEADSGLTACPMSAIRWRED